MAISDKWEELEPEKRQQVVKAGIVLGVIGIALLMYYGTGQDKKAPPPPKEEMQVIQLGDERLEDDIRAVVEREREEQRNQNEVQNDMIQQQQSELESLKAEIKALEAAKAAAASMPQSLDMPAPDAGTDQPPAWPAQWSSSGNQGGAEMEPVVEFVGDIGTMINERNAADLNGKKKEGKKVYLPPSFMKASLLTGLNAKTLENAQQNPEPMMLRIQAPAVLPNEVSAQLEGCFVIAHGYGSLASERVEARLVSLNCVDYEGRAMIDQEIQGIVVDKDGVKGLAGRPVSKMGANMARLVAAGFFQGAGEALEKQATTTSVSPLGTTQSIDTDQIGKVGAGKGLNTAAAEISKVYLELVRQASPVIEIGPTKEAAVLITKGVWLEIQDYEA